MEDSWYLMFALPEARFLLDGRVPFYGPEHVRRVTRAMGSAAQLRQLLDDYRVDTVVVRHVDPSHQPMAQAMRTMDGWGLVVMEDRHAAFVRQGPQSEAVLAERMLTRLPFGYEAQPILGSEYDSAGVRGELALLPDQGNTRHYRNWVEALVRLRPLTEPSGQAGPRAPQNEAEAERVVAALDLFRSVADEFSGIPTVRVYHALAAVTACELDEARQVLVRITAERPWRETLFLEQEIALRLGQLNQVRAFVDRFKDQPEARGDPWLLALEQRLEAPPACSGQR
jgi:hypothetical protein